MRLPAQSSARRLRRGVVAPAPCAASSSLTERPSACDPEGLSASSVDSLALRRPVPVSDTGSLAPVLSPKACQDAGSSSALCRLPEDTCGTSISSSGSALRLRPPGLLPRSRISGGSVGFGSGRVGSVTRVLGSAGSCLARLPCRSGSVTGCFVLVGRESGSSAPVNSVGSSGSGCRGLGRWGPAVGESWCVGSIAGRVGSAGGLLRAGACWVERDGGGWDGGGLGWFPGRTPRGSAGGCSGRGGSARAAGRSTGCCRGRDASALALAAASRAFMRPPRSTGRTRRVAGSTGRWDGLLSSTGLEGRGTNLVLGCSERLTC